MTAQATRADIKFTYQDYILLPEDKRYELIEGELKLVPAPNTYHQRISRRLLFLLQDFAPKHKLGEVFPAPYDVVLSEENVIQPDILFISKERAHLITENNIQGDPDLVIEIISPSREDYDRELKRKIYARYEVLEYGLIDPVRKTVEVMVLRKRGFALVGTYREGTAVPSPHRKGFSFDPVGIF